MRLFVALWLVVCLIGCNTTLNIPVETSSYENVINEIGKGKTLYVGGTGPNNYTRIQDAINDANDGDKIFVYSGIYYETLEIYKGVTIEGENKDKVIIDGRGEQRTVFISANDAQIDKFTINNGREGIGIELYKCTNCKILDCNINDCTHGILFNESCSNTVDKCFISENKWHGICLLSSKYNMITNSTFFLNYNAGIYIYDSSDGNTIFKCHFYNMIWAAVYVWNSENNLVKQCMAHNCPTGFVIGAKNTTITNCTSYSHRYIGILIYWANNVKVKSCELFDNDESGIRIRKGSSNIMVEDCMIHNNTVGAEILQDSSNINMADNTIRNNELGIYVDNSREDIVITRNNIYNNGGIGVYAANNSIVDARYNYWGTILGPITFGLLGDGIFRQHSTVYFFPWSFRPY